MYIIINIKVQHLKLAVLSRQKHYVRFKITLISTHTISINKNTSDRQQAAFACFLTHLLIWDTACTWLHRIFIPLKLTYERLHFLYKILWITCKLNNPTTQLAITSRNKSLKIILRLLVTAWVLF